MKFQRLIVFFYIWLLAEGAVRKWLFPALTDVLYFVKYLLAIIILIRLREFKNKKTPYLEVRNSISVFVLFCILSVFYTTIINSPLVGVLGMVSYLCFVPVTMALPHVLDSEEKIRKVLVAMAIISIGVSILAIIQYYAPPDAFINKYASKEEYDVATAGEIGNEVVRVTTLFSYHSGNAVYALFSFVLTLALLFEKNKNFLLRNLIYFAFSLSIINLFMSGSRSVVFIAVFVAVGVIIAKSVNILNNMKMLMGLVLAVSVIAATLLFSDPGQKAFGTWNTRYESGNETNEYSNRTNQLYDEIKEMLFDYPGGIMGYGIGSFQNASSRFNTIKNLPGAEDQAHRIGLELGPMGLILWYLMMLSIFIYSYRVYRFVKTPFLKNVCLILMLFSFWGPGLYRQTVVNWVDNVCWWTCLGIVISIKQIELDKRAALAKR